ncbi:MAG: N-acetylmuramoyl-L-alanine amidase [Ignavibacteriae bacterium]|nr:N-acetylmuramoyl-L-alanine amidase [Ignavibacteriota bacterium]
MLFVLLLCGVAAFALLSCAKKPIERATNIVQLDYPAELPVVRREHWGWTPGEQALPDHTINRITIHHGGEEFSAEKDVLKYLPGFQTWSREEKHWIDIPYHFIIDLKGNIYEARPINLPGDTNTSYDPTGHALMCVLGNYENHIISKDQLNAIIGLTAFLAKRFSVPVDSIRGHKDYAETLCPGKDLYRYLRDGTIVKAVSEKMER